VSPPSPAPPQPLSSQPSQLPLGLPLGVLAATATALAALFCMFPGGFLLRLRARRHRSKSKPPPRRQFWPGEDPLLYEGSLPADDDPKEEHPSLVRSMVRYLGYPHPRRSPTRDSEGGASAEFSRSRSSSLRRSFFPASAIKVAPQYVESPARGQQPISPLSDTSTYSSTLDTPVNSPTKFMDMDAGQPEGGGGAEPQTPGALVSEDALLLQVFPHSDSMLARCVFVVPQSVAKLRGLAMHASGARVCALASGSIEPPALFRRHRLQRPRRYDGGAGNASVTAP
jgi:hypothetical protein